MLGDRPEGAENTDHITDSLAIRMQLYIAVKNVVEGWRISQIESAKRLGVSRSVLNRILTGNSRRASIDLLVEMLLRARCDVSIIVKEGGVNGVEVVSCLDNTSSKGWVFDAAAGTLTGHGSGMLQLTTREAAILNVFMRNPRTLLSRTDLAALSGSSCITDRLRSIDVLISRLKSKLREIDTREIIKSERGKGYRFLGGAGFLSLGEAHHAVRD
jgi:predicted XRE-type DNA-binding protein